MQQPVIVILDGHTLNPGDLSWKPLQDRGKLSLYPRTSQGSISQRAKDADILIVNKVVLDRKTLETLPKLKGICVTATGLNNVDLPAAEERGIPVYNVAGYGTQAVAQHVFALLLELTNRVGLHASSVKDGDWSGRQDWCYWKKPIVELAGRTLGIYGFGRIGQAVARIGRAFEMRPLIFHKHSIAKEWIGFKADSLDHLFENADVLSLNTPLNEKNKGVVSEARLRSMPGHAYLINTARGGLIDEMALYRALRDGWIEGAALDVLAEEPPPANHPLFELENCLITPHLAWASKASRQRLLNATVENVDRIIRKIG